MDAPPRDATPFVPADHSMDALVAAAAACRGCDLYENATQTVFGAGPASASVMMVGEQPGDVEDRRGEPFVGPAGKLLDRALVAAGIARDKVYVTNAVKHFRFKPTGRGNRRLHQKPDARHITACRPWLAAELDGVRPRVVVALGATAAASLLGPSFRLTQHRGERLPWPPEKGPFAQDDSDIEAALATLHPSAVLRGSDEDRQAMFEGLVRDLSLIPSLLA